MKERKFKQTEIGLIPEDWEVKELGEIGNVLIGLTYSPNDVAEYGTLVLRSSNIKNNSLIFENNVFVDKELSDRVIVKENDILICVRNGSRNLIGKCALINKKTEGSAFGAFMSIYRSSQNKFIFHAFQSNNIQKQIDENLGATINQITNKSLNSFQIPLPPLSEQEKIAEALSDCDAWIESIEQLIAKKRQLKQGAMQKLLSPKEDWEVRKLGEVAWFQEGPGLRNWQFTKSGMKVINVTNLENGYLNLSRTDRHISINEFQLMYKHFEIDENDIVVASSGNSYGKVAVVRKQDLPLLMNTSVIRFKPLDSIEYKYLLIFLKSSMFKNQIDLLITGGAQPNFGPAHLNKIEIYLPKSKQTQTEIATILSDMDAEIETLEQKLQKAKDIKLGMMQDLLTGKVRLV